ncbi:MAG: DUF2490 domain-containing protein [Candidatus Omnitrophota bacterium]
MKKIIILSAFLSIVFTCLPLYADDDFQHWDTQIVSWKLNNHWQAAFEEEFHLRDNAGTLAYQHTDFGIAYSALAEWITLGFNYRQAFEKQNDDWKYENIPHLNATLKFNLGDLNLSNRFKFEYKNREDADNIWRYANTLTIKFPVRLTRFKLQPFLSNEIFIDLDQRELNTNRIYTGLSLELSKNLEGRVYYVCQSRKTSGKWAESHILGSLLKLSF